MCLRVDVALHTALLRLLDRRRPGGAQAAPEDEVAGAADPRLVDAHVRSPGGS